MLSALLSLLLAFSISWDASPDPSVIGYRVYYGTASGNYTTTLSVGTATSVVIPDPPAGVAYYAVVTACDAASIESLPSAEASYIAAPGPGQKMLVISDLDPGVRWIPEQSTAVNVIARYRPRNDAEKSLILAGKPVGVPVDYFFAFAPWSPCEFPMHMVTELPRPDRPRGTKRAVFVVPVSRSCEFFIRLVPQ